ncbi:hypothetical protein B0H16DRAFT_1718431 [Mycena metata]|uniref:Uncharacterized protein n=1 Tax=Mycena metata TaxID=1033252 RepID=A0AAD7JFS7_9AGAR|nr:hypothetical protein B0H16DRAFT_1718431 [Mycena metata]
MSVDIHTPFGMVYAECVVVVVDGLTSLYRFSTLEGHMLSATRDIPRSRWTWTAKGGGRWPAGIWVGFAES